MKKTLGLALAVLLTVTLTSCSDNGDGENSAASPSATENGTPSPSPTESSATSPSPTESDTSTPPATTASAEPPTSEYCATLKASQEEFSDLDITTLSDKKFTALGDRFDTLADQAPAQVADDWATIGDQLDKFKRLLAQAGLTLDDIKTLQKGKLPKGVDPAKIQALAPKLQKFTSDPSLENAMQAISDNAESECDITLG